MKGVRDRLHFGLLAVGLFLVSPGVAGALVQGDEGQFPGDAADWGEVPSSSELSSARIQAGSCDGGELLLDRLFLPRFADLEWWATGLAPGTTVGVQIVDPSGRLVQIGSVGVDHLCEASGAVASEHRVPGAYTLVITGTRVSGGQVEMTARFNVVSYSRVPTPTATPPPGLPPTRPGGVRASAVNHNTVRVDWTDNSDNENGFRIDSDAGQFRVAANIVTFNVGGLLPESISCFSVLAFNQHGESFGGTSCAVTPPRPTR